MMDVAPFVPWIAFVISVFTLFGLIKNALSSGEKKLEERMSKAEKTLVDHDRRIQRNEDKLEHLPSKDSVTELKLAIVEMGGKMNTQAETLGSVSRTVHRIDDYLRQEGKG